MRTPDERRHIRYWDDNDSSPCIMTMQKIEELVAQTVKEKKGRILPCLRDKVSLPFILVILEVNVPPYIKTAQIDYDKIETDPVEYI